MSVSYIDVSEIPKANSRVHSEEYEAVRALETAQAIKFPCRWNHSNGQQGNCAGVLNARHIAKAQGRELYAKCLDKTVYVARIL